jgi:hypothetical protein
MKTLKIVLFILLFLGSGISGASGALINLFEWGLNIDGDLTLPGSVDATGFNFVTGLGAIDITISGAGSHSVDAFFDHEIDEEDNTFFNEFGTATGSLAAGQSWEIDEPGFVFGDIYDNFLAGTLDNTNAVPFRSEDDVSMALGWDFNLDPLDAFATINFLISDQRPASGFYLTHTDPESNDSIYFSSDLAVTPIPEPATILLLGTGIAGLIGLGRRRFKR